MLIQKLKAQAGTLLLLVIALTFVAGALTVLELGTPRRMGPGAFPLIAGLILTGLCVVTLFRDLRMPAAYQVADWRSVGSVAAAVAVFAIVTPLLGVLPAAGACAFAASFAVGSLSHARRAALVTGAVLGVWLIFLVGLRLPLEAFRGF
ncbi:tripartite tricarboxylate transporter TctB family protein [Roseibium aggregatum]|uniref:Tripartite tricarboxylate transporter TctB family protein n=1 Tax=Roseibium aggregatum TaxID=187304 RepID=A0A939EDC0_9HYPH|nr:tripartite tricarboxylate transporter TctB family protein [Roseibium aggregatum]MBN9671206.1 tripartite tricarboxylate transporter TctB family protein [Roseibium aggregatum]